MFNEYLIHLCDCTCLNVFHILNLCWSNTKRFLSVLIVFGKYFIFAKMSKISKIVLPCSSDLVVGKTSRMPPVASLLSRFTRPTGGSKSQSRKRPRKFFKNTGRLCLAICLWVEASVASLLKSFRGSLRGFLVGGPSNREKHLDTFFKILSLRCLATCPSNLHATWVSHEKRVFCASKTVFNGS